MGRCESARSKRLRGQAPRGLKPRRAASLYASALSQRLREQSLVQCLQRPPADPEPARACQKPRVHRVGVGGRDELRIRPGISDHALDLLAKCRKSGEALAAQTTAILDELRPDGPLRKRA